MRLSLYSGPLARYYAGLWQGALSGPQPADMREELLELARDWRDMAAGAVQEELGLSLYWEENLDGACMAVSTSWESWYALLLWALCREQGEPLPVLEGNWLDALENQPVLRRAQEAGYVSRTPTLTRNCELFLPCEEAFFLTGPDPASGQDISMGSSFALLRDLETLKKAAAGDLNQSSPQAGTPEPPLTRLARQGLAALEKAARWSTDRRVPIRLDYGD